jgi:hypothetical protein
VGKLHDPSSYADTPKNKEEYDKFAASTEVLVCVIQETQRTQDPEYKPVPPEAEADEDEELWGPKTSAGTQNLGAEHESEDVAKLVNLGLEIPEAVRPKLDEVLRCNAAAFGVGGRLGHIKEKALIPVKEGTQPVSMPMYSALPAKREVIDKQMDLWFERDVIEPSTSP